jgi:hypothetical protein
MSDDFAPPEDAPVTEVITGADSDAPLWEVQEW